MNVWAISPLAFFPTGFLYFEIILRSQKSRVKKRKKFCELWNFHNTGWGNAPHKGYNLTILDYNQPQTTCSINAFTLAHLADEISSAWCFWWSKGSGWKYQLPTSFKLQMQKWVKDGIVSWQKLVRLSFFSTTVTPLYLKPADMKEGYKESKQTELKSKQ